MRDVTHEDHVGDAMHVTRGVEEGIVSGCGVALLCAIKALDKLTPANPARRAEKSGADGWIVVGKLLKCKDTIYGFEARKGKFTDPVQAGIIDPTKVVRHALQDAASVACLLVTTEAIVAPNPSKRL